MRMLLLRVLCFLRSERVPCRLKTDVEKAGELSSENNEGLEGKLLLLGTADPPLLEVLMVTETWMSIVLLSESRLSLRATFGGLRNIPFADGQHKCTQDT